MARVGIRAMSGVALAQCATVLLSGRGALGARMQAGLTDTDLDPAGEFANPGAHV